MPIKLEKLEQILHTTDETYLNLKNKYCNQQKCRFLQDNIFLKRN